MSLFMYPFACSFSLIAKYGISMYMVLRLTRVSNSLCIRELAFPPPFFPAIFPACLLYKASATPLFTRPVSHSSNRSWYLFRAWTRSLSLSSPSSSKSSASSSGIMRAIAFALLIHPVIISSQLLCLACRASSSIGFFCPFCSCWSSSGSVWLLSLVSFISCSSFSSNFEVLIFSVAKSICVLLIMLWFIFFAHFSSDRVQNLFSPSRSIFKYLIYSALLRVLYRALSRLNLSKVFPFVRGPITPRDSRKPKNLVLSLLQCLIFASDTVSCRALLIKSSTCLEIFLASSLSPCTPIRKSSAYLT